MNQIELCKHFIEHCTNDLAKEQVKLYLKQLEAENEQTVYQ
jgi:hypothetical protein